ncbi:hypothetical protein C8R42DRAFT_643818 [Lentinula raphanica]|nr:hypothetical protein C8R42DRAFT_643818 [Lentinula raphanica]
MNLRAIRRGAEGIRWMLGEGERVGLHLQPSLCQGMNGPLHVSSVLFDEEIPLRDCFNDNTASTELVLCKGGAEKIPQILEHSEFLGETGTPLFITVDICQMRTHSSVLRPILYMIHLESSWWIIVYRPNAHQIESRRGNSTELLKRYQPWIHGRKWRTAYSLPSLLPSTSLANIEYLFMRSQRVPVLHVIPLSTIYLTPLKNARVKTRMEPLFNTSSNGVPYKLFTGIRTTDLNRSKNPRHEGLVAGAGEARFGGSLARFIVTPNMICSGLAPVH